MRGQFRLGLVALSIVSLIAVFEVGLSAALDNPPPAATPSPYEASVLPTADAPAARAATETAEPIALAELSSAGFGQPPEPIQSVAALNAFESLDPPFAEGLAETAPLTGLTDTFAVPFPDPLSTAVPGEPLLLTREQLREREAHERRDRIVALAAEVSTLASDAELDGLIAQLQSTVAEKRAAAELKEAEAALQRLVAAFPHTGAATAAREMLTRRAPHAPAAIIPVEAPR